MNNTIQCPHCHRQLSILKAESALNNVLGSFDHVSVPTPRAKQIQAKYKPLYPVLGGEHFLISICLSLMVSAAVLVFCLVFLDKQNKLSFALASLAFFIANVIILNWLNNSRYHIFSDDMSAKNESVALVERPQRLELKINHFDKRGLFRIQHVWIPESITDEEIVRVARVCLNNDGRYSRALFCNQNKILSQNKYHDLKNTMIEAGYLEDGSGNRTLLKAKGMDLFRQIVEQLDPLVGLLLLVVACYLLDYINSNMVWVVG